MAATHCWQALTGGNLEGVARPNDARCTDYRFFALREAKDGCTRNKACGGIVQDGGLACPGDANRRQYELRGSNVIGGAASYWLLHRDGRRDLCDSTASPLSRVPHSLLTMLPDFQRRPIDLHLRKKAAAGTAFRILTLGGSMTAGTSCLDSPGKATPWGRGYTDARQCAWSSRFARMLEQSSGVKVENINRATAGTQSATGLANIANFVNRESFDLVFTDYSVNDGGGGIATQSTYESDLGLVTEALIDTIALLLPNALHVIVIQNCPACRDEQKHTHWSKVLSGTRDVDGQVRDGLLVPTPSWGDVKMVAAAKQVYPRLLQGSHNAHRPVCTEHSLRIASRANCVYAAGTRHRLATSLPLSQQLHVVPS